MSTVPLITYACKVPSGVPSPVRDDATSNSASVNSFLCIFVISIWFESLFFIIDLNDTSCSFSALRNFKLRFLSKGFKNRQKYE